jgi:hypothetical protein
LNLRWMTAHRWRQTEKAQSTKLAGCARIEDISRQFVT